MVMGFEFDVSVISLGLFAGMLLLLEVGRWLGRRRRARDPEGASTGLGTIEGAIFALLGLLIAFTFSGAASRLDTRRQLIVRETNAIGTAYLRLDLLPAGAQPRMRELLRRYVDARVEVYRSVPDVERVRRALDHATALQREIWTGAVAACQDAGSQAASMLVLPALNAMIDISAERTMAARVHPPRIIFLMLLGLALISALLAGYGLAAGRRRSFVHAVGFGVIMAITIHVILDIEYPRLSLIQMRDFDQALIDLRQWMR